MDNQFDNGYNPAEPQRPFTERPKGEEQNPADASAPNDARVYVPETEKSSQPQTSGFEATPENISKYPEQDNTQVYSGHPEPQAKQAFPSEPAASVEQTFRGEQAFSGRQAFYGKQGFPTQQPASGEQAFPNEPAFRGEQPIPNQQAYRPVQQMNYAQGQPRNQGFVPEPPLVNTNRNQGSFEPQTYNPIRHTATFSNSQREDRGYQGYDPTVGVNPQQPVGYQGYQMPVNQLPVNQPLVNQLPVNQLDPYSSPYDRKPEASAQQGAKKSNTGLIVLIIVLASLLAASVAGLVIYIAMNSPSGQSENNNSPIQGFTLPNGFNNGEDEKGKKETVPEFDDSDYSDKVNPDYKGLELNKKPEDSKNVGAEYAYSKISDSVVGIMCFANEDRNTDEFASQGSGIIISEDGYVITNSHVIGDSKKRYLISVYTSDGKEHNAGVVGFDTRTDIALLKIDGAEGLSPAEFCDSDYVELGEDIMVVGNPGGIEYRNSMTKGIVSALDRESSTRSIVKYIQTDAAINPGNSGGPTVNMYGQVIGIASAKIVSEQFEGMGFAIPSNTAKQIVDSLMKHGYVEGRVRIGISGTALTYSEAQYYEVPQGILVDTVDPEGPCGDCGLAQDDIIIGVDGKEVVNFSQVYEILEEHKEGDKIMIKYYRKSDDSEEEVEITLQADK